MKGKISFLLFVLLAFIILTPNVFAEDVKPGITSVPVPAGVQGVAPKAAQLNPWQYELSYDNGIPASGISWTPPITAEQYFAVKFNISNSLIYPLSIDKIRFFVLQWDGRILAMPVKLVVYDSDGVTPLWNFSLWPRSLATNGEWVEVDCGLIVSRDFYIALVYSDGVKNAFTFLGFDTAPPNGHDYQGPPMQTSSLNNFMIRAVVSEEPVGGHLMSDTLAVNFLPTTLFLVPIVALSAYLLLNRRKIRM